MKKILIALTAGLILSATLPAMAQRHRHTPQASITVNTKSDKNGNTQKSTAIVAYSDTADVDTAAVDTASIDPDDDWNEANTMMGDIKDMLQGAFMPIASIFIMFFLSPVMIIGLIIYFIIKSRNQKLKLAEMAIKNGQPIPQDITRQAVHKDEDLWAKGVKKIFLGIGLAVLSLFMHSSTLVGFGFFVAIYGCGQAFIAYTNKKRKNEEDSLNGLQSEEGEKADSQATDPGTEK